MAKRWRFSLTNPVLIRLRKRRKPLQANCNRVSDKSSLAQLQKASHSHEKLWPIVDFSRPQPRILEWLAKRDMQEPHLAHAVDCSSGTVFSVNSERMPAPGYHLVADSTQRKSRQFLAIGTDTVVAARTYTGLGMICRDIILHSLWCVCT